MAKLIIPLSLLNENYSFKTVLDDKINSAELIPEKNDGYNISYLINVPLSTDDTRFFLGFLQDGIEFVAVPFWIEIPDSELNNTVPEELTGAFIVEDGKPPILKTLKQWLNGTEYHDENAGKVLFRVTGVFDENGNSRISWKDQKILVAHYGVANVLNWQDGINRCNEIARGH